MRREVTVGGGHAGGQDGWLHFGLGEVTDLEIRVVWPGGVAGEWQPVEADRFYVVRPGAKPERFDPA
jgi:hypothetical protein